MIRLSNVQKTYPARRGNDAHAALRGIDLDIAAGEIVGVIGRSGAGKSTLIRCINLLERPTSGSVIVDGAEVTTLSKRDLPLFRRQLGMVFQHFNLLSSRTVYGNIALPLELAGASKAEIAAAVDPLLPLVGLDDKRDRYPAELSGGQKQRVGIARALSSNPKVLLCDEVTSALDPETTRQILTLLKDINKRLGLTMVVITHEMAVVKALCDRVAVMDRGVIVEEGNVSSIFANPVHATTQSLLADEFMEFRAGTDAATDADVSATISDGQEG
ncbi:MAG TPA: ABC transporter ATP-binding protein [Thalassospira lucentensis]|uniref:Cell division ATP-binding protein FtsE n=1 Tax=Thalassospira lucentensis TaxID=168935 RepID=A0A358HW49_9PROT|nr:ATP-binding cassette domain-containing protein [Thalassospira lucentensis]HBU99405.1 ABC transporter ATP-binding protein [Thalassospira lucentensis]HCW66306.1 ABC transporter ATP-binding protein [Thalassospira lucentensis]